MDQLVFVSTLVQYATSLKRAAAQALYNLHPPRLCCNVYAAEYGKEKKAFLSNHYDPRPPSLQGTTSGEITALQQNLKHLNKPVALLHVLKCVIPHPITATTVTLLPPIPHSSLCKVATSIQASFVAYHLQPWIALC